MRQIQSLITGTLAVLTKSVERVGWAHLLVILPGNAAPFKKNIAVVANRLQHFVQFDRQKVGHSSLDLDTNALPLEHLAGDKLLWPGNSEGIF